MSRPFPEECATGHRVHREMCFHCVAREQVRWAATGYLDEEIADRTARLRAIGLESRKANYTSHLKPARGPRGER